MYKKAMEISLSMEAAELNTKSFKSSDTPINKLISRTSAPVLGKSSRPCTCCGHPGADPGFWDGGFFIVLHNLNLTTPI